MKPSTEALIASTRKVMEQKYPGYAKFPNGERVLLCMAWLCDAVKVRELGTNRGEWVEAFLDSAGVAPGNPWCASALTFACKVAEVRHPAGGLAAVATWNRWFDMVGMKPRPKKPERGHVAMHNAGKGKGHIGIVVKVLPLGFLWSIEGNTSSGEAGSQRDGDGLYRRLRHRRFWSWGFGEL